MTSVKLSINKGCAAICIALIILSAAMTGALYWITGSMAAILCGLVFSVFALLLMALLVCLVRKN